MSGPIKIVAIFTAREGEATRLKALLDGMIAPSRAEAGNLRYDLWRDTAEPRRFVLDELYVDDAAVAAHRATPYVAVFRARISDLAERTAFELSPSSVA